MAAVGEIPRRIPEFNASNSIKIAPNTSVPVTDRLVRLIDAKPFQRLRMVRQLSLSHQVFPSATHTRFSHALGVYSNILAYLRHLDTYPEFRRHFDERDYTAVMLAGLLHDLGHYPYSHQLDHLEAFPAHESLTIGIIQGDICIQNENLAQMIREDFGIQPEEVTRLLGPVTNLAPKHALLKQLIDSPIDADKCDYLPRDSYYCGVDYGTGFDRERFIKNLAPSIDGNHLCMLEKGLMSAERFQLARYWMYRSVYWGHTVRALIRMLSKACEFLKVEQGPDWLELLLSFNDYNFLDWLHTKVEGPGKELVEMVHFRRRPYKRIYTVSYHREPDTYEALLNHDDARRVTQWFEDWAAKRGLTLEPHYILWDVPPKYKNAKWETFPVRLSDGQEIPIARESPTIHALSKAFLYGVRKIRLFCHPALSEEIEANREEIPTVRELLGLPPTDTRLPEGRDTYDFSM